MKKITLVLIGIVLISSLIFASRAMSWRGGPGWMRGYGPPPGQEYSYVRGGHGCSNRRGCRPCW